MVLGGDAAPGERGQRGLRADLDHGVPAAPGHRADAVQESHGFADVPHPVVGGGDVAEPGEPSGHVGDQADGRLVELDAVECGAEVVVLEDAADLVQGGEGAGDDALVGGVDGGQGEVGTALQERLDILDGGGDRGHAALGAHRLHQPGPRGDQPHGVGEAEQAGDRGGDDLADAVPDEHVGAHAPGHPLPGEGVLEGEQGGLGVLGAVDRPGVFGGAEQQVAHGAVQVLREQPVARVDVGAELREGLVEGGAHAGVLGALAGEHEGRLADAAGALVVLAGRPVQEPGQGGAVGDRGGDAVRVVGAGDVGGVAEGVEGEVGPLVEQPPVVRGLLAQGGGALGGEGEQRGGGRAGGLRRGARLRCLLQDHRADGAGEAEAVHDRAAHLGPPRLAGGRHAQRVEVPGDAPGRGGEVQVRVDGAGAQLQHRLDDADDAGGRLHVAQVGLHRRGEHGVVGGVRLGEHVPDGAELDRVAERGAGAVRLHVLDVLGGEAGRGQRGADHLLLRGAVGHGQSGAVAVLADGGAAHQGEHPVAVTLGVGEQLEDQDAAALGARVTVGRLVEGLALPVRGEHLRVGEHHRDARVVQGVDAAAQRDVGLAGAQGLHRQVQCDQGGRAGGVDAHAGSAPPQEVRQPARQREHRDAGGQVAVHLLVRQGLQLQRVVDGTGADVDAAVAAAQRCRVDVGVLQGLPGGLQQQALLGVHVPGLLRGDVEEGGVEEVHAVEEAPGGGVDLPLVLGGLGGERGHVPPVLRDRADPAAPLPQEGVELVGRGAAAGESQTDSDDRDRLGRLLGFRTRHGGTP